MSKSKSNNLVPPEVEALLSVHKIITDHILKMHRLKTAVEERIRQEEEVHKRTLS